MAGKHRKAGGRPGAAAREAGRTTTPLLEFVAESDFHFVQHNASPRARQEGRGGERYLTTSQEFANQVLAARPHQFRVLEGRARLRCLPRKQWGRRAFRGKRVLFLLPMAALGENVATLLFLHAFAERHGPAAVGVFCARSASDIYYATDLARVYPLWIPRRELKSWDVVIDLDQLESRRDIEIWPVDMESELLAAFGLEPSPRFPSGPRAVPPDRPLVIGILPLASSPLRTLPPSATLALARALAPHGRVRLCLNRYQHQGRLYMRGLGRDLPAGVAVVEAFDSIGGLMAEIARFDYAVYADSGPAHISKLFAAPGLAVYSSAPGDVLQGRFTNLARWTVPFEGPHCRAPCGLAKVRRTADGRVGCMGSLGVGLAELPGTPGSGDASTVERLLLEQPVPCMARLAADPAPLVEFVLADLASRREKRCQTPFFQK